MKAFTTFLALAATAIAAHATTMITIDGKVGVSSVPGYATGDSVSITFVLADYTVTGYPPNYTDEANEYDWYQDNDGDAAIWGNVKFTGSTGSFVPLTTGAAESYIYIGTLGGPDTYFNIEAGADEYPASAMGIAVGDEWVNFIFIDTYTNGVLPGLGVPNTDPETYLSTVYGTYPLFDTGNSFISLENETSFRFIPQSMTISQVPEPSTTLLTGSALALLGLARRRR